MPKTGGTAVSSALHAAASPTQKQREAQRAQTVCRCQLHAWPWMPNPMHLPEGYALQLLRHCLRHAGDVTTFAVARDQGAHIRCLAPELG